MTELPTDEELSRILRDIKDYGDLRDLGKVADLGWRTLYRHAEEGDRPAMGSTTRKGLVKVLAELGLLEGYDATTLVAVVEEIRERAEAIRQVEEKEALAQIGEMKPARPGHGPGSEGSGGEPGSHPKRSRGGGGG